MKRFTILLLCVLVGLVLASGVAHAQVEDDQNPYDRIVSDANSAMQQLNGFWLSELANRGISYVPPSRLSYYRTTGNSPCGFDSRPIPKNAVYCPVGNFIEFDIDWFVEEYTNRFPGDANTFFVLAHEWGHSVQNAWATTQPGIDEYTAPYRKEVQADCLAGVFLKQALTQGTLIEEAGDGQAIWTQLVEGGDGTWFDPATHGRPDQRVAAFANGYTDGNSDYCRQTDGIPQE